ncbi:MAG TPA: MBL fold metallo-hydrolase [Turneriella sp.]|nr:MBL fold metallo-hydrolase [Turneriella sp.]
MNKKDLLLLTAVTLHCGTYRPQTQALPAQQSQKLAETQLFKPATRNLPQLVTLNTGSVEVDTSLLLDIEKHPQFKNTKTHVPVLAHLVRHPQKGDILIDTGFDASFARSGHGNFGCMGVFFDFARQNPGSDIAAQLLAHNAKLTAVYFTHMHVDHTAGAPALAKDIPYIAGKGTLADSYADIFGLCMKHLDGIETIKEIDFSAQPEVAGVGRVFDIFGDGTVWAIHTPGHSAGHMSFLVNAKEGAYLVTGDASHTAYGFQNNMAPGKMHDHAQGEQTLATLRALAARHPQMKLVFGHDPEQNYAPVKK